MDVPPALGWVSGFEPWEITREHFPCKVGGMPAWLSLNLPSQTEFLCNECGNVLTFCLQLYAPDDRYDHAFHRSLYFFICQPCGNNFAIIRNQLPRDNQFFGYNPLEFGVTLDSTKEIRGCCADCGLPCHSTQSNKSLGKVADNISRESTLIDSLPNGTSLHKRCEIARTHKTLKTTFPEYVINITTLDEVKDDYSHEHQLYQKYLSINGQDIPVSTNKIAESPESDICFTQPTSENNIRSVSSVFVEKNVEMEDYEETYDAIEEQKYNMFGNDTSYDRFCQITGHQDVIYYERHGNPLWVSNRNRKLGDEIMDWEPPKCSHCGGNRSFEFQILPQLLYYLDNERVDFSSIAVYTCANSCAIDGYVREFVRPEYEPQVKLNGAWKGIC